VVSNIIAKHNGMAPVKVVVPVSFEEVLTSYMELTGDFPISYPVRLEEYQNSFLKDSQSFASIVLQLVALSRHGSKFNITYLHVCEAHK
jgi:hypothetical protein